MHIDLGEDGKTSYKTVDASTEVLIVYTPFSRIHSHQRISHDVFKEWTYVDLAKDETERISCWISEHDEFIARLGFVDVQLIR